MKADEKRQAVARKYDELIGRNHYSQHIYTSIKNIVSIFYFSIVYI